MPPALSLDQLPNNSLARIVQLSGDEALVGRLAELGIMEDEEVRVIGRAPLGDPLEIDVHGLRLSLRASDAAAVEVVLL